MADAKLAQRRWNAPMPVKVSRKDWGNFHHGETFQFVTTGWDGMSGETIAIVYGDDDEQERANANLIAAAPDLYEALSEALDMIVDACRDGNYSASQFNRLKATLAKARGQ